MISWLRIGILTCGPFFQMSMYVVSLYIGSRNADQNLNLAWLSSHLGTTSLPENLLRFPLYPLGIEIPLGCDQICFFFPESFLPLCEPFQSEYLPFQFREIFFLMFSVLLGFSSCLSVCIYPFWLGSFSLAASSYLRVRHLKPERSVCEGALVVGSWDCQICCRWTTKCQFIDIFLWQVFPQKESLHSQLQPIERVERSHHSGWSFLIFHVSQQDTSSLFSAVFGIHESVQYGSH